MNKEEAFRRKKTYDNYMVAKESEFGKRLDEELDKMEQAAVSEAMKSDKYATMENYYEMRGRYQAVQRMRLIFREIENEYKEAVPVLEAEIVETAPVDTSAAVPSKKG